MYLQIKPDNGDGVLDASPMPKLDQRIWKVKKSVFFSIKECHTFLVVIPPPFMGKEDDLISMKSGYLPSKTERERGRCLLAITRSSFFDGLVGRNLCPKECLTTFKTVM